MIIQITNVNMHYEEGNLSNVRVYFDGYDQERTLNLNGCIELAPEEYSGNESVAALEGIARNHIVGKVNAE